LLLARWKWPLNRVSEMAVGTCGVAILQDKPLVIEGTERLFSLINAKDFMLTATETGHLMLIYIAGGKRGSWCLISFSSTHFFAPLAVFFSLGSPFYCGVTIEYILDRSSTNSETGIPLFSSSNFPITFLLSFLCLTTCTHLKNRFKLVISWGSEADPSRFHSSHDNYWPIRELHFIKHDHIWVWGSTCARTPKICLLCSYWYQKCV